MAPTYLHHHGDFKDLILIVSEEKGIDPVLIEKDYWVMQGLYGLQQAGYRFELKGGTSLSKGYQVIDRFSEDIDIHIHPPVHLGINENPKNTNPNNIKKRLDFYDRLAEELNIDGFIEIKRDTTYDDTRYYRSGGIRLYYPTFFAALPGVKDGVLLEVGFDTVNPNRPLDISSWALDKAAASGISLIDNQARDILCYDLRYTFVEKLQTILTKYRVMEETGHTQVNFLRQYYDIYQLLQLSEVQDFLGSAEYQKHKHHRFPKAELEIPVKENQAILLENSEIRTHLKSLYQNSKGLYYSGQPDFDQMIAFISTFSESL